MPDSQELVSSKRRAVFFPARSAITMRWRLNDTTAADDWRLDARWKNEVFSNPFEDTNRRSVFGLWLVHSFLFLISRKWNSFLMIFHDWKKGILFPKIAYIIEKSFWRSKSKGWRIALASPPRVSSRPICRGCLAEVLIEPLSSGMESYFERFRKNPRPSVIDTREMQEFWVTCCS